MKRTTPISFRYYLAAILVPLLLVAPAGVIVSDKINAEIESTHREIVGLNQVQQLGDIIGDLQNTRGLGRIYAQDNDATIKPRLDQLERQIDQKLATFQQTFPQDSFATGDRLAQTLKSRNTELQTITSATQPNQRFEQDTASIRQVQELIQGTAVRSGLIHDNELVDHFLAELVVNGLADLVLRCKPNDTPRCRFRGTEAPPTHQVVFRSDRT
ncbi:MAG: hypothetical protein HW380_3974, partial [Magnetococcales bacterium]|nr:hypothetical protein [Magnetococcales bacterium]